MTPEERQLLLKDLCTRLPYGVKVENTSFSEPQIHTLLGRVSDDEFLMLETYKSVGGEDYRRVTDDVHYTGYLESIKPYLRPMSSMTEEENKDAREKFFEGSDHYDIDDIGEIYADTYQPYTSVYTLSFARLSGYIDWLNAHHFDYRRLISMGLANEAPVGMYK